MAATDGLLVHAAVTRPHELELRRVLVTDSVAVKTAGTLVQVCSIAPMGAAIAFLQADAEEPAVPAMSEKAWSVANFEQPDGLYLTAALREPYPLISTLS